MKFKLFFRKLYALIESRITYKMMGILLLGFVVIGIAMMIFISILNGRLTDSAVESLQVKTRWITTTILSGGGRLDLMVARWDNLEERAKLFLDDEQLFYIVFYDAKGKVQVQLFKQNHNVNDFDFPKLPEQSGLHVTRGLSSAQGISVIDIVRPIKSTEIDDSASNGSGQASASQGITLGWVRVGFNTYYITRITGLVRALGYVVMVILFLFFALIWYQLNKHITGPITQIAEQARAIGSGDLKKGIRVQSNDEIGVLANAMNDMIANINAQIEHGQNLVDSLAETIELLSQTINDIYSISAQQSSGATEQAASVYQASSTSKEIAASASRIAETAEEVASNARLTSGASDQGKVELASATHQVRDVSTKVEEVAKRMVELGEKSQKISRIIDLINEISEQTNLLSLNAAIEASGAGEGGKRFSVVAQEIRRLANRTLEATQVVRELVEEIQAATNTTVMVTEQSMKSAWDAADIIERMDQSFQNIIDMVEQTLKASTEITLSTRQQTTACEQMVSTVMEVSEVAAEVEKGAKETEQALTRLGEISERLKELAADRQTLG